MRVQERVGICDKNRCVKVLRQASTRLQDSNFLSVWVKRGKAGLTCDGFCIRLAVLLLAACRCNDWDVGFRTGEEPG